MVRKLLTMGFWRIAGLAAGALGSIWAARCLAPEKLGISGMVNAYGTQAFLLVHMGLAPLLIREYKSTSTEGVSLRDGLISETTSYRLVVALMLSIIWAAACVVLRLPEDWWLATAMGILSLIASALTADWVLQAQENQVTQQRLAAFGGFLSALLLFGFIRRDSPAGSDLAISTIVVLVVCVVTWCIALNGKHRIALSLGRAFAGLPRLWKGRWLFLSGILIYIYVRLQVPMLGWLRSTEELGQYRSALQVANGVQPLLALVPALLYPRMIAWSKISKAFLWNKQIEIAGILALISAICIAVTFVTIPLIYPILFGPAFQAAALPCCLLIASHFVVLVNGVFSYGLWSLEKDFTMLVIMAVTAATSLALNLMLIPKFGMLAAAAITVFAELLILGSCVVFQYWHCNPPGGRRLNVK